MSVRESELDKLSGDLNELAGDMHRLREGVSSLRRSGLQARDSFRRAEMKQTSIGADTAAAVRKATRDGFSRFASSTERMERTFDRVGARFDRLSRRED